MNKKDFKLICVSLLIVGVGMVFTACSKDDEPEGTDNEARDEHEGYWTTSGFVEMIPQNDPPYTLLIKWDDEQGKEALKQYIAENDDVVLERIDFGPVDQCYLITTKVIQSPDFFVSMSYKYKSNETILDAEYIRVLPRIVIQLVGGKDISLILDKYANVITLDDDPYDLYRNGHYVVKCNLRTSHEVLQLASELFQRADVEWAEPEMYIPMYLDQSSSTKIELFCLSSMDYVDIKFY